MSQLLPTPPGKALSITSNRQSGDDGPWWSFSIRIGTPPQDIRVLPSTSQNAFWVVNNPEGCYLLPSNCGDLRGGLYNSTASSTYQNVTGTGRGSLGIPLPWLAETSLGYGGSAYFALDNVTIVSLGTSEGPVLQNQAVLSYSIPFPYIGFFGLHPNGLSTTTNQSESGPLGSLRDGGFIPSLTWGYTAGSFVANIPGSLTLGGYDSLRIGSPNVTIPLGAYNQTSRSDMTVGVSAFRMSTGPENVLSSPINMIVDSSVSELWMPGPICDAIEEAFGLEIQPSAGLYLLNSTQQADLRTNNASITFTVGLPNGDNGETVDITLDYNALSLTAECPYLNQTGNPGCESFYFPVRRAMNGTFFLGRTFLQSAYIFNDFDRNFFQLSQAQTPDDPSDKTLTAVYPPGVVVPSGSEGASGEVTQGGGGGGGSNAGAIAGGVVGGIAALVIILLLGWFCWYKPRKQSKKEDTQDAKEEGTESPPETDTKEQPDTKHEPLPPSYPADREKSNVELDSATSPRHELESPFPGGSGPTSPNQREVHEMFVEFPELHGENPKKEQQGGTEEATTSGTQQEEQTQDRQQ